ncbi:YugN-like family protein [Melghirimyces thermohalophilus]|uniref:YugN-like family protein n=1 Tax=Melghirimyces thermohalophilus TaxID=1236220 RepID=A0A1G6KJ41_9BACL|nr:YugN family protein [Melghirimyces thermohalophilus]SDC30983.1 YugN-like family protein [Melghirimyces thermohalophilus]
MIPLQSSLENQEGDFIPLDRLFNEEGFVLGGGYEYDHGYYDKALDWENDREHRIYLRIPVTAVEGSIGTRSATLRIGQPFVLKHIYQDGGNQQAQAGLISGSVNQFAEPADKDAKVNAKWTERAQSEINQLERRFQKELQQR